MNWRIRMNTSELKQHKILPSSSLIDRLWNTSKIQFHLTSSIPNIRNLKSERQTMIIPHRSNIKRCRSKETINTKKSKISSESPSFVLVCGQNICGQLGLSTRIIERHKPQYLKIVNEFNIDENIQSIYAGAMHSCALTVDGYVYTWGCNDDGALGRITNDMNDEYNPGLFLLPEQTKSVCAGDSFTVALTKSGRVYISGCFRSSEGILGLFEYKQIAQQPIVISFDQPIKQIACGADFCLLLTNNGELYSFGSNEIGQLGRDAQLENNEKIWSKWLQPSQVLSFQGQHILQVWTGSHGFFVLTQDSSVHLFACGANSFGQLGHSSKQPIYSPIEIHGFPSINKIACGLQHTLILDTKGCVYGLGRSDDGRLGTNLIDDVIIPTQIDKLTEILDIAAGGSVSFAIDKYGQIYSFGMGDTCQTGHGDEDIFLPTLIKGKQLEHREIQQISVGAQHTLFLVKDKCH